MKRCYCWHTRNSDQTYTCCAYTKQITKPQRNILDWVWIGEIQSPNFYFFTPILTDSTIAPPKKHPAILFNERFMTAQHQEGCDEKNISSCIFLFAEGYRTMTSGRVARDAAFQEIRPRVGFETGDFVKEKGVGGYRRTTLLCRSTRPSSTVCTSVFFRRMASLRLKIGIYMSI